MSLGLVRVAFAAAAVALLAALAPAGDSAGQDRDQTTTLISRSASGGVPNGPSTNGVISNDLRYARLIAFQSDGSDVVAGDTNGVTDVFAVKRGGSFSNKGTPWQPGGTVLASKPRTAKIANGPSFAPAVDGGVDTAPRCVAFLSAASNLLGGDTNGKVDAFLSKGPGVSITRVSLPDGKQSTTDTTQVAISRDCSRVAFVAGGKLYVRTGGKTRRLNVKGNEADPSFAAGKTNDLVFAGRKGVYLSAEATGSPKLVAKGGRDPAYNSIKRQTLAYEKTVDGRVQVFSRDLGRDERLVSHHRGRPGDGDSRDPVIGNSGYYVAFESDAANLGTNAGGKQDDGNGQTDVYLYTEVRDLTLVQSVESKADPLPLGGVRPSMSFYANYLLFDSPAPLSTTDPGAPPQVFMRYLGGV
jgi:hypothetical protein